MAWTKAGNIKARQKMIERFGSEAAYRQHMHTIASKGGSETHRRGKLNKVNFQANRELARKVGRIGGYNSSRKGIPSSTWNGRPRTQAG